MVSFGVLLSAGVMSVIAFTSWRRRIDIAQLGTVSARWLADHRANDRQDSER
jgi:hypothetical protein